MRPAPELDFGTLYVFGAGGHGQEIAWIAQDAWRSAPEIRFVVDDERHLPDGPVEGRPVMLLDEVGFDADSRYVVGDGDGAVRRRVSAELEARGGLAATVVHASVQRSASVTIAPGAVVFPGTILTANVTIGRHAHLNAACTVSHDSTVGDYATLSPGVHVAGRVHVGSGVFVGVGANVINGLPGRPLVIGDDAVIAAGACVPSSVETGALMAGVPALRKR
jgi:sugar O-acyltransferase (sialic acid O-acetyltransferase NeuD family)